MVHKMQFSEDLGFNMGSKKGLEISSPKHIDLLQSIQRQA